MFFDCWLLCLISNQNRVTYIKEQSFITLGILSVPSTTQLFPSFIFTIASSVMLPLNRLFADDPSNANIITTAAIPKIKANFAGEID